MKSPIIRKYWWAILAVGVVLLNYLASVVHYRLDLTSDRRFTVSAPTKNLLTSLDSEINVEVFLSGDLPVDFRNLRNSVDELLQEFQEDSKHKVRFEFNRPGEGLDDEQKQARLQFLDSLGLHPTNVKVQSKSGESQEERLVYPSAIVSSNGRSYPVDLLQGQDLSGGLQTLNTANALLEYKFANAIQKVTQRHKALIGYLAGNGEPLSYNVYDLIERTLKPNYNFSFVPLDSLRIIPPEFDAVLIVKPGRKFDDRQKLMLDQYVMHGGKIVWMIDNLYAEMDSLMRSQSDFVAFDRGLGIEDLLFKYGARINGDLVQDLQCDQLPLAVGNYGDKPQMQLAPWVYFPLVAGYNDNPISKNLNFVLSIFPNSIDTVEAPGIRKTVLLATSDESRTLSTPAIVSLNSVKTQDDLKTFNRKKIPVAVLLEGRFQSLFANRLSSALADTLANVYHQPYLREAENDNKMIVVSDADIAMNVVTQSDGPLTMGTNQFTKVQYANRDFLINSIEYLVNPSGILSARSKTVSLRLLDTARVSDEKVFWQILNIGLPVLLIAVFGFLYQAARNRKYTA